MFTSFFMLVERLVVFGVESRNDIEGRCLADWDLSMLRCLVLPGYLVFGSGSLRGVEPSSRGKL